MKCKNCFHYAVCLAEIYLDVELESCKDYVDSETTITIPTVSEKDNEKIRKMASNGYAFVKADLLQKLVDESAELAKLKISEKRGVDF